MPKYFFTPDQLLEEKIILTGDTAHHLLNVLRICEGDKITLCDGASTDFFVTVESTDRKKLAVLCKIEAQLPCLTESYAKITLYQSLCKGDKMDFIIQKCVELGVSEIVPVETSRSVIRVRHDFAYEESRSAKAKKTVRYQRIAESAAGQSMRGIIPVVYDTINFYDAVKQLNKSHLILVAYENEKKHSLKTVLSQQKNTNISIWIGPEGGFTSDEIFTITNHGATTVTLGKRILRTETAAISMVAQILCLTEN